MTKTGRNDPCPCGSGRKYKRCCLHRDDSSASVNPGATAHPGVGSFGIPITHPIVPEPMGPAIAAAFSYRTRRRGRLLFDRQAVQEISLEGRVLCASFEEGREILTAEFTFAGDDEGDAGFSVLCSCPAAQDELCHHVYAMGLAWDEQPQTSGIHDDDTTMLHLALRDRLREEDLGIAIPGSDQGSEIKTLIATRVERIARTWASPETGDDLHDLDERERVFAAREPTPAPLGSGGSFAHIMAELRLCNLERLHQSAHPEHLRRQTRIHYLLEPHGDRVTVVLRRRSLGQNGSWGKLTQIRQTDPEKQHFEASDRWILAVLRGAVATPERDRTGTQSAQRHGGQNLSVPTRVGPEFLAMVLPRMLDTGRCFLISGADAIAAESLPQPLRAAGGEPLRFVVRRERDAEEIRIVGTLHRGEDVMATGPDTENATSPFAPPDLLDRDPTHLILLGNHHVAIGTTIYDLEPLADAPLAHSLLVHGPLFSSSALDEQLLRRIIELPGSRHLEDDELIEVGPHPFQAELMIDDPRTAIGKSLAGQVQFDYRDGHIVRPAAKQTHFSRHGRLFPRDFAAEAKLLSRFDALGVVFTHDGSEYTDPASDVMVPMARLDDCVLALIDDGWDVFAAGLPVRRASPPSLRVSSGKDWFELEGHVEFDGKIVELPELLQMPKRKKRGLVQLDDGSLGLLASEWLQKWRSLLELADFDGTTLRLRSSQIWLLDAMLRDRSLDVDVDQTFADARAALRGHSSIEPCRAPHGFGTTLRSYQRDGLGWLTWLHRIGLGGCLADDMGLGKTVQVLALLALLRSENKGERRWPNLVVAPRSLIDNWQREAARFCPELKTIAFTGTGRFKTHAASVAAGFCDHDLVLVTYGSLRRDIEKLADIRFHYAILDEAQAIKNGQSQVSKAARLLRAEHRLALTGTPIENNLGDIWSLFEFLNPGMLGRSRVFKDLAGRTGVPHSSDVPDSQSASDFLKQLTAALRPFLLRRTKREVLPDLPEKSEQVLHVELPASQRQKDDELRHYYRERVLGRLDRLGPEDLVEDHLPLLEALLRLRQAACHPGLIEGQPENSASGKFETILPMLEELRAEGHKVLVFSQFTSLLALLKPHLDASDFRYEYLDGKTAKRQECVDRFQEDPDCQLFLISIKAGGVGLNLTAADYVFLLDPWWNPAVESQAIDRTHRIGQTRKVFAYRLIAKDTVEERVAELQADKRKLVDTVLAGGGGGLRGLTVQDVARLLG